MSENEGKKFTPFYPERETLDSRDYLSMEGIKQFEEKHQASELKFRKKRVSLLKDEHNWQTAGLKQIQSFRAKQCTSLDDMIPLGKMHIDQFAAYKTEINVLKSMGMSSDIWDNDTQLLKVKNLFPKFDKRNQIYYMNEWNHRDNWIPNKKNVGVFGCSVTFGTGTDKTYAKFLEDQLPEEYSVWNFGTAAYNMVHMANKYAGISNIVDFDTIIMVFPHMRLMTLRDGLFRALSYHSKVEPETVEFLDMMACLGSKYYDSLFQDIYQGDEPNLGHVLMKFADFIVDTAQKKGTKVIIGGWDDDLWFSMKQSYPELVIDQWYWEDRSADKVHPGQKSHKSYGDIIYKKMAP